MNWPREGGLLVVPIRSIVIRVAACCLALAAASAQVSYERLLGAADEPDQWLTYSGAYDGHRFSSLDEIHRANVDQLELKWVFQTKSLEKFEVTPLVADGVMYFTQAPNTAIAIDPATGREFWRYAHQGTEAPVCCGRVNRGLAILGETLYMGTIDGKLVALDAASGNVRWQVQTADPRKGYALTLAPLVIKDKVLVGMAGGDFGIRGYLDAYDAETGERAWRFHTIPGPGQAGHDSWEGDSWKHGGGSIWVTGSYDPELNLTYWGIGNPAPDWNGDVRKGDNLYTESVVALDADSGELKWHFQFTPHDVWDWDSVQVPVLVDLDFEGRPRKLMLWANRNGFYYVFDRETGEYLAGRQFTYQNWAKGLDEAGRPMRIPGMEPSAAGIKVFPAATGATNWYSPSYSPRSGLFYVSAWEYSYGIFRKWNSRYEPGQPYIGGTATPWVPDPINHEDPGHSAVLALDPLTGERKWEFSMTAATESGILTTGGDLLLTGAKEGYLLALDAATGELLLKRNLGGPVYAAPITYRAGGEQVITIPAGNALFTFGLREEKKGGER